ncbi:unnamed protein product, partial [Dibothriocephalus latus]
MDLFIETLTGTAFELKVSPNDTVMSIKSKIQRVEGIPVGQQHLIWQNGELSDHQSLRDCSIPGGATLRLVLGLRGGPINAYRTPATLRLTPLHFAPPSSFERITPPPRSSWHPVRFVFTPEDPDETKNAFFNPVGALLSPLTVDSLFGCGSSFSGTALCRWL